MVHNHSSVLCADTLTSDYLLRSQDHLKTETCSVRPLFLSSTLVKEGFLQSTVTSCISWIHTHWIICHMCVQMYTQAASCHNSNLFFLTQRLFEIRRDCSLEPDHRETEKQLRNNSLHINHRCESSVWKIKNDTAPIIKEQKKENFKLETRRRQQKNYCRQTKKQA